MKHIRTAMVALVTFFVLLLGACATSSGITPEDIRGTRELEPLRLQHDAEVFLMRILLREGDPSVNEISRSRNDADDKTGSLAAFHYVGVRLGNGLFLDANLNLALDIVTLLGLDTSSDFVVELDRSFGRPDYTFEKDGSLYNTRPSRPFAPAHRVRFREGFTEVIPSGINQGKIEITLTDRRAVFDPGVFTELGAVTIEEQVPDLAYRFPGATSSREVKLETDEHGNGKISIGDKITIVHETSRNRLRITEAGAGDSYLYTVEGGLRYVNRRGADLHMRMTDQTVTVTENGRAVSTYVLRDS